MKGASYTGSRQKGRDCGRNPSSENIDFHEIFLDAATFQESSLLQATSTRYFLYVIVNGCKLLALVDSGCSDTCANERTGKVLEKYGVKILPATGQAACANGDDAAIVGVANISLTIGASSRQKSWLGNCYLVKGLPYDFIIGINTLRELQVVID